MVLFVLSLVGSVSAVDPNYQAAPPSGQYLASGIADAAGTGGEMYVEYRVWDGENGYYYYTYQIVNTNFSPYIQYLTISNPAREMYWVTGRSGGWNPQTGEQGNTWSASSAINQIAVVQWTSNDPYSNIYPGFSSWIAEEGQQFQFASKLPPSSSGFSVMQGDTSISASGLIAAPGSTNTIPRSPGYWKHQSGTKGKRKEADSVPGYLEVINSSSEVFDAVSVTTAHSILQPDKNSEMVVKIKRQLLSLWLNVVSSKLNYTDELVITDPAGAAVTITPQQVIADIEAVIMDTAATPEELEYAKDLAEILNSL